MEKKRETSQKVKKKRCNSASNSTDLLSGITLERDDQFCNFKFRLPDGGSRPANMTEVLLWETLQYLHELNDRNAR